MDLAAEFAQFKPEPALAEWLGKLLEKTQNDALKIQALTFELAYYKRIRFANKSEAFYAEQRELFEESWNTDTSALEAEVEQLTPTKRPRRERAGRQPLPEHLPRIEHRHEPESCTCGQCGLDLVKIGEDVSEQLDGGMAAPGLLTWVMVSKFMDHLPLSPQGGRRIRKPLKRQRLRCPRKGDAGFVSR